ncbi:MAG: hypothetical protein ABI397_01250 [Candidatus Saccharimonas sp.]
MKANINTPVSITSIGFGRNMQPFPIKMEWAGKTYQFIDRGIYVVSRRGDKITNVVTLSDGLKNFCLSVSGGIWTLIKVF